MEPFHSVRAGIIQPDGSKRYIIANGNDSHVFELTMSGSYRIYIQNETTESVFYILISIYLLRLRRYEDFALCRYSSGFSDDG